MIIQGVTLKETTVVDASIPVSGTNMLLYLDAGNTASYPGTGTTWYDISGNNNNTTGTSNTVYNSANGGYFNFTDPGWFTTSSAKYNKTYTGKTVFIAAKLASAMNNNQYRCLFGSNGTRNFNLYLYRNGSGNYQLHFDNNSSGTISNVISYTPGNWFTCGISFTTGNSLTYYYNGRVVNSTTSTFYQWISNSSENVGASDNYWNGPISVVGIYGSALSASQMLNCHNFVRTRYGLA